MAWRKFRILIIFTDRQIPETRDTERRSGILCFPAHFIRCPNMVAQEEGKDYAPGMSADMNGEYCMLCGETE